MNDPILNHGLRLAQEFGADWLQPIQARLRKRHPELTDTQLDEYDRTCREAMQFGHEIVPECWKQSGQDKKQAFKMWSDRMKAKYPWVSRSALSKTFNQGCYYAWHDGNL